MIKEQWRQEGRFVPGTIFPEIKGVPVWKDLAPRLGVAYDLFGDGRTALKFGASKYMRPMAGSFVKRYNPAPRSRDRHPGLVRRGPGAGHGGAVRHRRVRPIATASSRTTRSARATTSNFGKASGRRAVDDIRARVQRRVLGQRAASALQQPLDDRWMVSPSVLPAHRRRQHRAQPVGLHPVPGHEPVQHVRDLHDVQPRPDQAGPAWTILEYNSDTNTHISNDFEFSFNSRLPNGSVVFGGWTAQHNIEVTCDQENPNGSAANDLYFDISIQRGGRFCDERNWTSRSVTTSRSPARCR